MPARRSFDVLVVGAGPAGIAAAVSASGEGRSVAVVDDNPDLGGQIWRGERPKPTSNEARAWFARAEASDFVRITGTRIVGLAGDHALMAESDGRLVELDYRALILATGARELFLPFPGWTLPGMMGAGGLQAMVKAGLPIEGKSVVVAGSGPLLLAVASALAKKGAKIAVIADQAPIGRLARFALGLWSEPAKLRQAIELRASLGLVAYRPGWWPVRAEVHGFQRSVTLTNGRKTVDYVCDYLACGFGLIPNLELASLLGCKLEADATVVDTWQATTVPDVYSAGEATGIGGIEPALIEGQVAGLAATGKLEQARTLFQARDRASGFARKLEATFTLRDELRSLTCPDTIICRCEDVTAGQLADRTSWVDAKLQTRCGMGPCQGRVCGGATKFLYGWDRGSIRPPLYPVGVANLGHVIEMSADLNARADSANRVM